MSDTAKQGERIMKTPDEWVADSEFWRIYSVVEKAWVGNTIRAYMEHVELNKNTEKRLKTAEALIEALQWQDKISSLCWCWEGSGSSFCGPCEASNDVHAATEEYQEVRKP